MSGTTQRAILGGALGALFWTPCVSPRVGPRAGFGPLIHPMALNESTLLLTQNMLVKLSLLHPNKRRKLDQLKSQNGSNGWHMSSKKNRIIFLIWSPFFYLFIIGSVQMVEKLIKQMIKKNEYFLYLLVTDLYLCKFWYKLFCIIFFWFTSSLFFKLRVMAWLVVRSM